MGDILDALNAPSTQVPVHFSDYPEQRADVESRVALLDQPILEALLHQRAEQR
jgi:hypothetical protein